jgi:hypothetical protein
LAAGVAHDFNNLLTVIMMGAEVAGSGRPSDVEAGLRFVQDAAQRAKALTGRMLGFSRARPPARVVCRLEQVVMNLILNARDAVGEEGTVTLEVDACTLGAAEAGGARLPGSYVQLRVRDDGTGIPPEVLPRIFDPLFTTKALGKGTGIGLATSLRIVRDAGGDISVRTELGVGTEFTVLLPAVSDAGRSIESPREDDGPGPRRRVAVQISDPLMRELVVRVLEGAGHACFVAHDGDELARRRAQVGSLDLVVVRGRRSPEQRGGIAATSGAPLLLLGGADPDDPEVHWLPEPFSGADLLQRVAAATAPA